MVLGSALLLLLQMFLNLLVMFFCFIFMLPFLFGLLLNFFHERFGIFCTM